MKLRIALLVPFLALLAAASPHQGSNGRHNGEPPHPVGRIDSQQVLATKFADMLSSTASSLPAPQITAHTLLRRQRASGTCRSIPPDYLDAEACNTGACALFSGLPVYCTVYPNRLLWAYGNCCLSNVPASRCAPRTTCEPYSKAQSAFATTLISEAVFDNTLYCGLAAPACGTLDVEYGYKETFLRIINCVIDTSLDGVVATLTNAEEWRYSGLSRNTATCSSTSGVPTTTSTPVPTTTSEPDISIIPVKSDSISPGAIAGIVIGSLVVVSIAAIVIVFLLRRSRNSGSNTEGGNAVQGLPPAPMSPNQPAHQTYYSTPKAELPAYYGHPQETPTSPALSQGYAPSPPHKGEAVSDVMVSSALPSPNTDRGFPSP